MPAPYVPVINTVQAELRFTMLNQQVENILYFEGVSGFSVAAMETLGQSLALWWTQNMAPILNVGISLREVYLTDLSTQTGPTVSFTDGLPELGQSNEELMPNSTAMVVSFRTAGRGRSSRGRNYVAGWGVTDVQSSTFVAGRVTAVAAAYNLLNQSGYIGGWTQVVVSRFQDGNPRVTGLRQVVQNAIVTTSTVRTQRNRLPNS